MERKSKALFFLLCFFFFVFVCKSNFLFLFFHFEFVCFWFVCLANLVEGDGDLDLVRYSLLCVRLKVLWKILLLFVFSCDHIAAERRFRFGIFWWQGIIIIFIYIFVFVFAVVLAHFVRVRVIKEVWGVLWNMQAPNCSSILRFVTFHLYFFFVFTVFSLVFFIDFYCLFCNSRQQRANVSLGAFKVEKKL